MESPPTLENVYQAVYTLYRNPDPAEKEKASVWLGKLQESVYAWKIADEILLKQTDLEYSYFAAQTMRTKVQLSFHELPPESYASLRDSLIEHLKRNDNITNNVTHSITITQLCLALADLSLQMVSWESPCVDLIASLGDHHRPLLELLAVIPEEIKSRPLRLGANRRQALNHQLASSLNAVLMYLKMCLANHGEDSVVQVKVLECFTSWITIEVIDLNIVSENPIVGLAFEVLRNRSVSFSLFEAATDCICMILQKIEENKSNIAAVETALFDGVMTLGQPYILAVAHEELDKCINYCRIFTELAESFLCRIISECAVGKSHFAIGIFDMVLSCVGHHDYEVAAITFNLWYRLSEVLYEKRNDNLNLMFKPYIERLISALCRHCQMEPDQEGLLVDSDDFSDFRMKVSELIKDVVFIIGSSNVFKQMFLSIQAPNITWDATEAALFIMQSVAKNVLPEENDVVPKVVEAVLNLPQNTHIAVRYTSLLLLGQLCEWIEKHPESLEPILNLVLVSLQEGKVSAAAANCLQCICTSCKDHMARHFSGLIVILQSLDKFSLSNEDANGIIQGVADIVAQLPPDQIVPALEEMFVIQINPLLRLILAGNKGEKGSKGDPCVWLDRLATIFRYTNPHVKNGEFHPCQPIVTKLWPVLSSALQVYENDGFVMERCCRCLRFAIRCVGKHSANLLEPIIKQLVSVYQRHHHSCFLYLGSILVDVFANPENMQGLLSMLEEFITPTFALLQQPNGFRNHPDTVDDLFRLCSRFVQRGCVVLLTSSSIGVIIECALMAVALDHRDANMSVMKFFCDLIHAARTHPEKEDFAMRLQLVCGIIEEKGQELVNNLLHASVFCLHTYMLTDVADVIVELGLLNRDMTGVWLQNAISRMPTQNRAGNVVASTQQFKDFHTQITQCIDNTKAVAYTLKKFAQLYR